MVHDTLGQAGGAAGVVDGGHLVFIIDRYFNRRLRAGAQKFFVL